jgi:hypothetical protein
MANDPLALTEIFPSEIEMKPIQHVALQIASQGKQLNPIIEQFETRFLPDIERKCAALNQEKGSLTHFLTAKRSLLDITNWFQINVNAFRSFYSGKPEILQWEGKIKAIESLLTEQLAAIDSFLPTIMENCKLNFPADYSASLEKAFHELDHIVDHHLLNVTDDPAMIKSWTEFLTLSKQFLQKIAEIALMQRELWLEILLHTGRGLIITQLVNCPFSILYSSKGCIYIIMEVAGQFLGEGESRRISRTMELNSGSIFALVKPKITSSETATQEEIESARGSFILSWREVMLLQRIKTQEGVIAILEAIPFEIQGVFNLFLIEERYEDKSLHVWLWEQKKKLTEAEKYAFVPQLLTGLKTIHEAGIIHRDIKPHNILINVTDPQYPKAVICDFNLACTFKEKDLFKDLAGSPLVTSPECAKSYLAIDEIGIEGLAATCTPKIDVWAMGLVFYLMFFHHHLPWEVPYNNELEKRNLLQVISNLSDCWISKEFHGHPLFPLISKMVRVDPQQRVTAAEALYQSQKINS